MENQREELRRRTNVADEGVTPPAGATFAVPILAYGASRRLTAGDVFRGAAATTVGLLCVLTSIVLGAAVVQSHDPDMHDKLLGWAIILLLLMIGAVCSLRSAYYYFGGWASLSKEGRSVRRILLPWRWK